MFCVSSFNTAAWKSINIASSDLPGQAVISQEDENTSKGVSVTFLCSEEDQGNPAAEEYIWKR
jgi:hypothetical protein